MSEGLKNRKKGGTDYDAWNKFDAAEHGVVEEAPQKSEPEASKQWKDQWAEIDASKKRMAHFEKEKVRLEKQMKDLEAQRVKQERWFMGIGVLLFLAFTAVPYFLEM